MLTVASALAVLLACLLLERVVVERSLKRIPLRICITGTRGKSSVTRMLASVLRQSGRSVLAKTTGSEARYVFPDDSESEVPRRGTVSILEQKRLVRLGARLRVDCLVAEAMSLRPGTQLVEARHLLQPHIVAVTNVRRDHTDSLGESEAQIAAVLSSTVSRGTVVFVPGDVPREPFAAAARRQRGRIVDIAPSASKTLPAPELCRREFSDNIDVVCSVARHLGITDGAILAGIRATRHDAGRLRISAYRKPGSPRTCYFVNAFAANDPESTWRVLLRVRELLPSPANNVAGVFSLRADRMPRTLQWADALNGSAAAWFRQLFLAGPCPAPVRRRFPSAIALRSLSPREATGKILEVMGADCVVFGFGNFTGSGRQLAEHWATIGDDYGV